MASVLHVTVPAAPLLPLLLALLSLLLLFTPSPLLVHGTACGANTYNDGYVNVGGTSGGFTKDNSGIDFNGKSFSVEAWVRRSASSTGNRYFFGAGKTTQNDNKYLHLGVRDSNKVTLAFWGNDLDSGTGADPAATSTTLAAQAAGNQWKHLAFTYNQGSNSRDRKIWMNAVLIGSDKATANLQTSETNIQIGKMKGDDHWQGDIDELYVFMTTLSAATVAAHYAGNFWGLSGLQMVLWLRFTEGTGNNVADSSGSGNGVSGSGNTWKSSTDSGFCQVGYFYSYKTTRLSDPTTPVGTQSFVAVQMTDNWGNPMPAGSTATVSIRAVGGGTWLSSTPTQLSLVGPGGAGFTYANDAAGDVTIELVDSASNGRPLSAYSPLLPTLPAAGSVPAPTQTFTAASLASVVLVPPAGSEAVTYSPALQPLVLAYNTSVRAITSSLALLVTLNTGGTANYAVNGVEMGALTSGQATPFFPLPDTVLTNGFGVPCGLRSSLLAWLPLSYGVTADHSGRGMYVEEENRAGLDSANDRFSVPNGALQFNGASSLRPVVALPTDRFAISVWFRTSDASNMAVLSTSSTAVSGVNRLYMSAGVLGCRISSQESMALPGTWHDNQWHHLVWQLSASSPVLGQQIWVDGVVRAQGLRTSSSVSPLDVVKLGWGQNAAGTASFFKGRLDDWALFKRALTPAEIASLRQSGAPTSAAVAHCLSVGNAVEGHVGFEVVRAPWVLKSIGGQAGTGPLGMDELTTTSFSMAPEFVQSTFDYNVVVGPYTTGLRVSASYLDPSGGVVYATFEHGGTTLLANDVSAYSPAFLLPVGVGVLRLVLADGTYSFSITRPPAVLQALAVQGRTSWGAVEDYSAGVVPPFSAGLHRNYAVTVPNRAGLVRLAPTLNGPVSVDLNGDFGAASPVSATGEATSWFNMTQGAGNVLRILSADPTVNVTVTRLPPAVTSVAFSGMPAGTTVPPFVAGAAGAWAIPVKGVLSKLVMSVAFNSESVAVTVNGAAAGSASSGVPMDLTPLLLSLDQDSTLVTLTTADGVYSYTFQSGCPAPFQCWRTPATDPMAGPECEFKCVFCSGATIRRICLQERPACCGTAGVCTC